MRLFTVRDIEIQVHPLTFIVVAAAFVLGKAEAFFMSLLALLLHETAHVATAMAFDIPIYSVTFLPFGGIANMDRDSMPPQAEVCIASAGPLFSILLAGLAAVCCDFFPGIRRNLAPFLYYNLVLAAVNFLPALPLDGGRVFRAYLSQRMLKKRATMVASVLGIVFGVLLLAACVYLYSMRIRNLMLPMMGVFLLIAAISELLRARREAYTAYFQKNSRIRRGEGRLVFMIAVHENMRVAEALATLKKYDYNVLRVVDDGMQTLAEIDEWQLMRGMARIGASGTLSQIITFDRASRMC